MNEPSSGSNPAIYPVAAFVPDLMDRSKVSACFPQVVPAKALSTEAFIEALTNAEATTSGGTPSGDGSSTGLFLVDLRRPAVLETLSNLHGTGALAGHGESARRWSVVGFGSHVDADVLSAATEAGCSEAIARSVFFRRLSRGWQGS